LKADGRLSDGEVALSFIVTFPKECAAGDSAFYPTRG
jgi:hypothetical protein